MTTGKMVGIAAGFAAVGAVLGGLIGAALGKFTPDLYRAWFQSPDPHAPALNTVQIGAGLGIIQGLLAGLLLGCSVIIATAIRNRTSAKDCNSSNKDDIL